MTSPATTGHNRYQPDAVIICKSRHTRQLEILILAKNDVTVLAEFRFVEVVDHLAALREADKLLAVKTVRVV